MRKLIVAVIALMAISVSSLALANNPGNQPLPQVTDSVN